MRAHNLSLLLHRIWEAGAISRVSLSRETGLARSTVTSIVGALLEADLVEESHLLRTGGGRPPIALRLREDDFHLVGVEMGAAHVTIVRTNLRGHLVTNLRQEHDVQDDPDGAMALLGRLLAVTLQGIGGAHVVGIGLAVPSPLDPGIEGQLSPRILPAWAGRKPAQEIEELTGLPVFMDNDANLGALAEHWWGMGKEVDDFAFIKVATGVGSGLIVGGEIYGGATGIAGEIGHSAIDPHGPVCRCGLQGCLEAMVGSGSLLTRLQDLRDASGVPSPPTTELKQLIEAAQAGDTDAIEVVREAGHHLGVAIANLLNLLNPRLVVLGGRLTAAGDLLLAPLREAISARALSTSIDRTEVVLSELGKESVALGAATLVLQHALSEPSLFQPEHHSTPRRATARP